MGSPDSRRLAQTLTDVAWQLRATQDPQQRLHTAVTEAVRTVPGAEQAGVSLVTGRRITAATPTNDAARRMDELQVELDEGPCLFAIRDEHTVRIDDLATDTRWPRFGPAAAALGLRSSLSFRLYVHEENFGALNLYATVPHAFDDDSYVIGEMFARHTAMALAEAEHEHQFNEALSTRDVIGQAKGILMHRDHLTAEQAFDLLARTSQNANIKLVDLARWLVEQTEEASTGYHQG